MEEKLAYCGLLCQGCAIYLATREKDDGKRHKMRVDIAEQIKKLYGEECRPEDVTDCDGCESEARLFSGCSRCEIRKCARQKGVENCAHCSEYACEKLKELFVTDPEAKKRLDKTISGI
jgi:hypothetical protein